MVEALAQTCAIAVLVKPENRGKLPLFAGIDKIRFKRIVSPGDELTFVIEILGGRDRVGKGAVEARVGDALACRGDADVRDRMIGAANGNRVSITGLGTSVPERVADERRARARWWTRRTSGSSTRTGIHERRVAGPDEALSDFCLPPRERRWSGRACAPRISISSSSPRSRPTWRSRRLPRSWPTSSAPRRRAPTTSRPGARDSSTRSRRRTRCSRRSRPTRARRRRRPALEGRGLVDRATCVLFGDGAGAVVLERVDRGGFLGFELGADGSGGMELYLPRAARGSRRRARRSPPASTSRA